MPAALGLCPYRASETRNTCTSDCECRRKALCHRGCSVVFSRVTLFSFHSNQSDAVQSGARLHLQNVCFTEDVMVIAEYRGCSDKPFRLILVMVAVT